MDVPAGSNGLLRSHWARSFSWGHHRFSAGVLGSLPLAWRLQRVQSCGLDTQRGGVAQLLERASAQVPAVSGAAKGNVFMTF